MKINTSETIYSLIPCNIHILFENFSCRNSMHASISVSVNPFRFRHSFVKVKHRLMLINYEKLFRNIPHTSYNIRVFD